MRQEIQLLLGSVWFVGLVLLLGLGVGAIAGVNLPDGTVCQGQNLACRWFRFRVPKKVVAVPFHTGIQRADSASRLIGRTLTSALSEKVISRSYLFLPVSSLLTNLLK
jgi:hypothetical protein